MSRFFQQVSYAMAGIIHGIQTEKHLRFHIVAALFVIVGAWLTGFSLLEWAIICLVIFGVLALELVNAAIERTVDLVTEEWQPLAKQAKDLAAGAVLVYAVLSLIIGALLFFPKWF